MNPPGKFSRRSLKEKPLNSTKMTTEKHLDLIIASCRSLLALAEKRTPGAWERERYRVFPAGQEEPVCSLSVCDADGEFIAACAGAAEAGWRATIAACEMMLVIVRAEIPKSDVTRNALSEILAAYPSTYFFAQMNSVPNCSATMADVVRIAKANRILGLAAGRDLTCDEAVVVLKAMATDSDYRRQLREIIWNLDDEQP